MVPSFHFPRSILIVLGSLIDSFINIKKLRVTFLTTMYNYGNGFPNHPTCRSTRWMVRKAVDVIVLVHKVYCTALYVSLTRTTK